MLSTSDSLATDVEVSSSELSDWLAARRASKRSRISFFLRKHPRSCRTSVSRSPLWPRRLEVPRRAFLFLLAVAELAGRAAELPATTTGGESVTGFRSLP